MVRVAYGLEVGTSIGGYRVDGLIGRGGMGIVYSATHLRLGRKAALKVLTPELADDEVFRERFIRESQLAASLEHPSIIPIYDADEEEGVLYTAMRYVEGVDLERTLRERGPFSLEEALRVVEPVATALDAAHSRGLVHRDVKPANIMIEGRTGRVYLTDFGLAKLASSTGFTRTGSFLGTVHYCAPEQIEGKPVDGRADVYSLGCVLFHCLAGQPPFPRESEVAVIQAHLADPPPAVTTVRPELPRFLDGVIVTAMAKYPEVRFASGRALMTALREGGNGAVRSAPAARIPPAPAAPPTVAEPPLIELPPPTAVTARSRFGRRRWLLAAGVLAVLVAAGAAAALVALAHSGGEPAAVTTTRVPPPRPSLAALVAARLRSTVISPQRTLTARVRSVTKTAGSLRAMERSAAALEVAVNETRGWAAANLSPRSESETTVKRLFGEALVAQAAYASYVEGLPAESARLTKAQAQRAIALADRAEEAYATLSGAAPHLPAMPLRRADHVRLLSVVPTPKPKPKPQPALPPAASETTSEPTPPPPTPNVESSSSLRTYSGNRFSVAYPSGWSIDSAEEFTDGALYDYYDTTIAAYAGNHNNLMIRIDALPNPGVSDPARVATDARGGPASKPRYTELDFSRTTYQGASALRWEFLVEQAGVLLHKVDVFFLDGATGAIWAVLVQAPAAEWDRWRSTFNQIYESVSLAR